MNIRGIVKTWLEQNGYDGLYCTVIKVIDGSDCWCPSYGLMPCGFPNPLGCIAGHLVKDENGFPIMVPGKKK